MDGSTRDSGNSDRWQSPPPGPPVCTHFESVEEIDPIIFSFLHLHKFCVNRNKASLSYYLGGRNEIRYFGGIFNPVGELDLDYPVSFSRNCGCWCNGSWFGSGSRCRCGDRLGCGRRRFANAAIITPNIAVMTIQLSTDFKAHIPGRAKVLSGPGNLNDLIILRCCITTILSLLGRSIARQGLVVAPIASSEHPHPNDLVS